MKVHLFIITLLVLCAAMLVDYLWERFVRPKNSLRPELSNLIRKVQKRRKNRFVDKAATRFKGE